MCSAIIGSNSGVFLEGQITGTLLPHGAIDIVAGQIDTQGDIDPNFALQLSVHAAGG